MKTYKLSFKKTDYPLSYEQIKYIRSFENVEIDVVSNSQLMKRFHIEDYRAAIEDLKNGLKVKIEE